MALIIVEYAVYARATYQSFLLMSVKCGWEIVIIQSRMLHSWICFNTSGQTLA